MICQKCVMDSTIESFIGLDKDGCNYCYDFKDNLLKQSNSDGSTIYQLDTLVNAIKKVKRKRYDCIIGVSGGIDSCYALLKAKEAGLNPLAVHFDNGWNSNLSQTNIENLVNKLEVDLHTHVVDWTEYRSLLRSMMSAHVIDLELLMDNGMISILYAMARKHRVKYILTGSNTSTEGMSMPTEWNWFKYDKKNIFDINRKFDNIKINTFPSFGMMDYYFNIKILRKKWVFFLDYFNYDKKSAEAELISKTNFVPYEYKHYESILTRFYQGYILPNKFGVDKRKLHLSTLIISKQLTRSEAIENLKTSPYSSIDTLNDDRKYFLKKMQMTENEFDEYINRPPIPHDFYKTEKRIVEVVRSVKRAILK